ncbi:MAG: BlaI/MecI/CopY family transcriptional regulator [Bacillota bacterium]|nr:BlaI/MecI/CopY family transcriptional regulator [Bacillota bacterium]
MKGLQRIPDAELEIMMVMWEANSEVNSDYIMERLHKSWAKPTLLNLLNRLYDRGFVDFHKEGKFKIYSTKIRQEDYICSESKSFLKKLHHNSIKSFIAALCESNGITKKELKELENFIKDVK